MAQEYSCSKDEGYSLVKLLNLHESNLGYQKGALRQYRDSQATKSIHAREYNTSFSYHFDDYNPEQLPIEHFINDVVKPESVIAAGVAFVGVLATTKKPKTALLWSLVIGTCVQLVVDN
jgi:hypothetical protein